MKQVARIRVDRVGRVVVPKELRDTLGLGPGTELAVEVREGALVLTPVGDELIGVREGVAVYRARRTGDVEGALDRDRPERDAAVGVTLREPQSTWRE